MNLQDAFKKIKRGEHISLHTKNDILRINTMYNSESELIGYEISLRVTLQCNFSCRYCFLPTKTEVKEQWIDTLIKHVKGINLEGSIIILTGGEPTLSHKYFEILHKLESTGAHIVTQTNAALFSSNKCFSKLNSKNHRFFISFPSGVETNYNYITNSNQYKNTLEGIKKLSSEYIVTINYVIYKENYKDLKDTLEVIADNFNLNNLNLVISNLVLERKFKLEKLLMRYTKIMNEIKEPISQFKDCIAIGFTFSGGCSFPLCMLRNVINFKEEVSFKAMEDNIGFKNFEKQFYKNKSCLSCRYNTYCQGFPTEYIKSYGEKEIHAITD